MSELDPFKFKTLKDFDGHKKDKIEELYTFCEFQLEESDHYELSNKEQLHLEKVMQMISKKLKGSSKVKKNEAFRRLQKLERDMWEECDDVQTLLKNYMESALEAIRLGCDDIAAFIEEHGVISGYEKEWFVINTFPYKISYESDAAELAQKELGRDFNEREKEEIDKLYEKLNTI